MLCFVEFFAQNYKFQFTFPIVTLTFFSHALINIILVLNLEKKLFLIIEVVLTFSEVPFIWNSRNPIQISNKFSKTVI